MDEESDILLRRLFASTGSTAQDPAFVARVARQVVLHRRRRRILRTGFAALLGIAAATIAVLLAPFAPLPDGTLGMSLLRLPEQLDAAVQTGMGRLPLSPWLYLILAAGLLPIGATVWLTRRS